MRKIILLLSFALIFSCGCQKKAQDPRVQLGQGVGSDTATSNILVRPFAYAISDLIGQGLTAMDVTQKIGKSGFMEVHITLHNDSYKTKRFEYKFEWLDSQGGILDTKTSVWLPYSIAGNATSTIKGIAPRAEASTFRVITRKVK
ncbi:MAG: DUF1425 domain-containing protein [Sedimentisphaeraceae bacterium JB056]